MRTRDELLETAEGWRMAGEDWGSRNRMEEMQACATQGILCILLAQERRKDDEKAVERGASVSPGFELTLGCGCKVGPGEWFSLGGGRAFCHKCGKHSLFPSEEVTTND